MGTKCLWRKQVSLCLTFFICPNKDFHFRAEKNVPFSSVLSVVVCTGSEVVQYFTCWSCVFVSLLPTQHTHRLTDSSSSTFSFLQLGNESLVVHYFWIISPCFTIYGRVSCPVFLERERILRILNHQKHCTPIFSIKFLLRWIKLSGFFNLIVF